MTETAAGQAESRDLHPLELILALKQRVQTIRKEGYNPQGSYNFRGVDQVINACGPIERELGLLVWPELTSLTTDQAEYGTKRTLAFRTQVRVRYHFVNARTGLEHVVGPVPGEAVDTGDKSTAKAMSVALRVMYLQTLTIPTDEPDPDTQSYDVARPEVTVGDPQVLHDLEARIDKADTPAKLRSAFAAIEVAFGGEQATITRADAEQLTARVAARNQELTGAK